MEYPSRIRNQRGFHFTNRTDMVSAKNRLNKHVDDAAHGYKILLMRRKRAYDRRSMPPQKKNRNRLEELICHLVRLCRLMTTNYVTRKIKLLLDCGLETKTNVLWVHK